MADLAAAPPRASHGWSIGWGDAGPFLALAALVLIGFLINPDFLSANNIANVVTRSAFIAIIATFVIASGGLDLSVGSMAAFITGVMILFMNWAAPSVGTAAIPLGMAVALVTGLACGLLNGTIVTLANLMVLSDFVSEYLAAAVQGVIIIIAMLIQRMSKRLRA